jgi:L-serine/L-threonine ammonia-lyase
MDNQQPSGSFKIRGIGYMIDTIQKQGNLRKLVASSGGNAGLAVATVGREIGVPVEIYVPVTTSERMVGKLRGLGANVTVHGENWNAADELARKAVDEPNGAYYIPPFDHPMLWDGHASIVDEIKAAGVKPHVVFLSVGGGGLLCGVQRGLERNGWGSDVRIVAVETEGAASFAAGKAAGHPVMLPGIYSVATSLGARAVTPACLDSPVPTEPFVITDAEAVSACLWFLNEYRTLIEPACGATLAAVLSPEYLERHIKPGETAVVVVCGGSNVTFDMLNQWKRKLLPSVPQSAVSEATSAEDIQRCFPVMSELRPHVPEQDFVGIVTAQMKDGYRLIYATDAAGEVVAVSGFRFMTNLYIGKHIYVDDLVCKASLQRGGYGSALMEWIKKCAKDSGCAHVRLDSGVQRHDAHRFYLKNGFDIKSHSFVAKLT